MPYVLQRCAQAREQPKVEDYECVSPVRHMHGASNFSLAARQSGHGRQEPGNWHCNSNLCG